MNLERAPNSALEDFAAGVNTSISLDLGLLAIKAIVNTVTLVISAEVGMNAPLVGYTVLTFVRGNLIDGARAEVDGTMAKGSVTFYLDGDELWVLIRLRFSSPLFPPVNEALKIVKLGAIYPPSSDIGSGRALEQGDSSSTR
ncbi:hypothetical protein RHS02_09525, partial [Rhizoctonia solani]